MDYADHCLSFFSWQLQVLVMTTFLVLFLTIANKLPKSVNSLFLLNFPILGLIISYFTSGTSDTVLSAELFFIFLVYSVIREVVLIYLTQNSKTLERLIVIGMLWIMSLNVSILWRIDFSS